MMTINNYCNNDIVSPQKKETTKNEKKPQTFRNNAADNNYQRLLASVSTNKIAMHFLGILVLF